MHEKCKSLFCFLPCNQYFFFFLHSFFFVFCFPYLILQLCYLDTRFPNSYLKTIYTIECGYWCGRERTRKTNACEKERNGVSVHISIKQIDPSGNRV